VVSSSSRTDETGARDNANPEKGTGKRSDREAHRDKGDEDGRYPVMEADDGRSQGGDEAMNEIIWEVDEGGRRCTCSGDADGEYDGARHADHDLEDEMQSKHKQRS
jgi:hypothetical protein